MVPYLFTYVNSMTCYLEGRERSKILLYPPRHACGLIDDNLAFVLLGEKDLSCIVLSKEIFRGVELESL